MFTSFSTRSHYEMMKFIIFIFVLNYLTNNHGILGDVTSNCDPKVVEDYLANVNELTRQQTHSLIIAQWNNAANITPVNEAALVSFTIFHNFITYLFNIFSLVFQRLLRLNNGTDSVNKKQNVQNLSTHHVCQLT